MVVCDDCDLRLICLVYDSLETFQCNLLSAAGSGYIRDDRAKQIITSAFQTVAQSCSLFKLTAIENRK